MIVDEICAVLSIGMCSPKRHAEVGCDTCDQKSAAMASVRALAQRAIDAEAKLAAIVERHRALDALVRDPDALGDEFARASSALDEAMRAAGGEQTT